MTYVIEKLFKFAVYKNKYLEAGKGSSNQLFSLSLIKKYMPISPLLDDTFICSLSSYK